MLCGGADEKLVTASTTSTPPTLSTQVDRPHQEMAKGGDAKISLPPVEQQQGSHPMNLDTTRYGGEEHITTITASTTTVSSTYQLQEKRPQHQTEVANNAERSLPQDKQHQRSHLMKSDVII